MCPDENIKEWWDRENCERLQQVAADVFLEEGTALLGDQYEEEARPWETMGEDQSWPVGSQTGGHVSTTGVA